MQRPLFVVLLVLGACVPLANAQGPPDVIFTDGFDLLVTGAGCVADEQCASDMCVDGVCCTSECTGTCMACNTKGSEGTCSAIRRGQDPDSECGAVSCAGYYWGWGLYEHDWSWCYVRADVTAEQASCDGAGACHTAAVECSVSGMGGVEWSCDPYACLYPDYSTCYDTTPPDCHYQPNPPYCY